MRSVQGRISALCYVSLIRRLQTHSKADELVSLNVEYELEQRQRIDEINGVLYTAQFLLDANP